MLAYFNSIKLAKKKKENIEKATGLFKLSPFSFAMIHLTVSYSVPIDLKKKILN